ncbi:MAG: DUF5320 domain-containing protein [Candidatus Krumholzibacteria bacterium]|nr:DUF5320 domain-containing protein [Candidatus Krumholzibacteria bacterium]
MPRGDKRGPNGMGPMTGRGLGFCAGYDSPGFSSDAPPRGGAGYGRGNGFGRGGGMGFGHGFGYGRGRGFGRGWGYNQYAAPGFDVDPSYDPGDRRPDLTAELAALKEQVKVLEERIAGSSDKD